MAKKNDNADLAAGGNNLDNPDVESPATETVEATASELLFPEGSQPEKLPEGTAANEPDKQPIPATASQDVPNVTAAQLIAGDIPGNAQLPPAPGSDAAQGKGKRGRKAIPFPECNKCRRKHKPGPCDDKNPLSVVNVPLSAAGSDSEASEQGGANVDATQAEPEKVAPAVNHRQLAEITFDLTTNSLGALIGPEWRSKSPEEREAVIKPLELYLATKQMDDIPPGAILCFAIAMYSAPRLQEPTTKTKISLAWAWVKMKFAKKRKNNVVPMKTDGGKENPFKIVGDN